MKQAEKYFLKYRLLCLWGIMLAAVMTVLAPAAPVYAASEFEVTEAEGTAVIKAEALNVRSGPGKDYDVIGKVKAGEEFAVSGQTDNGWYRIAYDDKEGYVSGEYAEVTLSGAGGGGQGDAADIPDEEKAPIPGLGGVWQTIKAGGILSVMAFVLVPVILVAIGFTVWSMRRGNEEDDYEEDDWEEDGCEDDTEDDGYFEDDGYEYADVDADADEDEDPQEDVLDEAYLSREVAPYIEEEEALRAAAKELEAQKEEMQAENNDAELKQAMEKLAELQAEIERIKQKKEV